MSEFVRIIRGVRNRLRRVKAVGDQVARYGARHPHVLIACQPKVASTFISGSIAQLPGIQRVKLVPSSDRREQELSELLLRKYDRLSYVAQHHVRRSQATDALVARHKLQVVVVTRNIFDAVVSLRDHVRKESPAFPMAYITEEHCRLPDAELEMVLARLAVPWYLNFYMSWRKCPYATYVSYADVVEDPPREIRRIVAAADLKANDAEIEAAVAAARGVRLNVGVSGRGSALAPEVKAEIIAQLACYPSAADDPYVREMVENAL